MKIKITVVSIIVLILIQFIPFEKNQDSNKEDDFMQYYALEEKNEIHSLLSAACYNCHSNYTTYPWYGNVAPVSWYLTNHIRGGKKKLNFSEWENLDDDSRKHAITECIDMLEKKWMPIKSYTILHKEANLTDAQRQILIDYFKSL